MEKALAWLKTNKRIILVITGSLALVGMAVFAALGGFGNRAGELEKEGKLEEAIALHARNMEIKPSAATAAKMLDLAMEVNRRSLVLKVLREYIAPHLDGGDIDQEFLRGARWYIQGGHLNDDIVFWLEGELRRTKDWHGLAEVLGEAYERTTLLRIRYGNQLFAHWALTPTARELYREALAAELQWSILGEHPPNSMPNDSLLVSVPESIRGVEGLEMVWESVNLWRRCAYTPSLDRDFLADLEGIKEQDPLGVYWRIRAAVLLRGLRQGWQNPLGLDVAGEIGAVYRGVPAADERDGILGLLSNTLKPSNAEHARIFVDLAAQPGLPARWGRVALELLIAAEGGTPIDTYNITFVLDGQAKVFSSRGQELFNRLKEHYNQDYEFTNLANTIRIPPANALKYQRQLVLKGTPEYSRTKPVFLIGTREQTSLVNYQSWQVQTFTGGWQASWNPRGEQFILYKTTDTNLAVRIYSWQGVLQEQFTFNQGFPVKQSYDEYYGGDVDDYATISWSHPDKARIFYQYSDTHNYVIDLSSKTLTPMTSGNQPAFHVYIPQLDLYLTQGKIEDMAGTLVGEYSVDLKNFRLSSGGELFINDDNQLMYKDSSSTREIVPGVWRLELAFQLGEETYFRANGRLYRFEASSARAVPLPVAQELVISAAGNTLEGSVDFTGLGWASFGIWDEELMGGQVVWAAGGRTLPIFFLEGANIAAINLDGRCLLFIRGTSHHYYTGEMWVLEFR